MNFITFSPSMCNLWPASNSTAGGQLVTEYNIKSRETVATDPSLTYTVGPSYTHNIYDFEVKVLEDAGGAIVNSYTLSISEGRAVVNGHFVETLTPMTIDLVEANVKLANQSRPIMKGNLAIGIRTFFSTEQTMAGSILVENNEDMFLGIQLVVLPAEELITPLESPEDESKVTCDLKLATFTFLNNQIRDIVNLESKMQYLTTSRIRDLGEITDDKYVTKFGLNSKKLYAFAGKGVDPETGLDTWEDITDSTIVWDSEPTRTHSKPFYRQAQIITSSTNANLILPHKQVFGMVDDDGNNEYYEPRLLPLPLADYTNDTTGFVSKAYTKQIKDLAYKVSEYRSFPYGKQVCYIDELKDSSNIPPVSPYWDYGDYLLVGQDGTFNGEYYGTDRRPPFTMYVVIPGYVRTVQFVTTVNGEGEDVAPEPPENLTGIELGEQNWYQETGIYPPETQYPQYYPSFWDEDDEEDRIRGIKGDPGENKWVDYFRIRYYYENSPTYKYTDYYYGVLTTGPKEWSSAMLLTGAINTATEDTIGGFYSVSDTDIDEGYVKIDSNGHLKLVDYEILRSGTLAYQIGSDITVSQGDAEAVQEYINEYINDRVAFPSSTTHGDTISVIHIYLKLAGIIEGKILISGIDSRFNTAVELHFLGESTTSAVEVDIVDCQKIKIDPNIEGTPIINIYRSNLYYDPIVLQYIKTCPRNSSIHGSYTGFRDLNLWYEKLSNEDPDIFIDGMTVSEIDSPIIASGIDYWKQLNADANDNEYLVALKSVTFSPAGEIVGCGVLVANNSTDNVDPGDKIVVGEFTLPQGESLIYPVACLTRKLKVSGEFTSAYLSDTMWYVTDNSFSLVTGTYDDTYTGSTMKGTVAFHSKTTLVPDVTGLSSIEVWEPDSYHVFRGGAIN